VQSPAAVQPVAEQSGGRCNIAACSAAYSSFRASDCTYQPYSGPRQVCEKGGAGRTASTRNRSSGEQRAQRSERGQYDSARSRAVDLDDVAERVRRITRNDDDAGDDIDAPSASRSRVIVIERGYGWR